MHARRPESEKVSTVFFFVFQLTWIELNTEVLNFGIDNNVWYTCKKWQVFLKRDIGREDCYLFSVQVHLWIKRNWHPDTTQNRFSLYVGINHSCFWGTFYVLLFQSRYRSAGNSKQRADTSKKQQTDKGKRKLSSFCNSLVIRFFRWNRFLFLRKKEGNAGGGGGGMGGGAEMKQRNLFFLSSDLFLIEWHPHLT